MKVLVSDLNMGVFYCQKESNLYNHDKHHFYYIYSTVHEVKKVILAMCAKAQGGHLAGMCATTHLRPLAGKIKTRFIDY